MTKRYNDVNPLDALYKAARSYPGGVEALAQRMGVRASVLYKKLMPDVETNHVNYDEVLTIVDLLTQVGKQDMVDLVVNSFSWRHGHLVFKLPECHESDAELFEQVLEIIQYNGVLANALRNALDDKVLNERERDEIDRHIRTCVIGLIKLKNSVQAKYDEGK